VAMVLHAEQDPGDRQVLVQRETVAPPRERDRVVQISGFIGQNGRPILL
jgi:hypothetical protein